MHVAQRVPGDGGDLGLGASDDREPRDGGAAQIVERDADDPSLASRRCATTLESRAMSTGVADYLLGSAAHVSVAASSAAFSGAPTGIVTRAPVFDCRNRICVPS